MKSFQTKRLWQGVFSLLQNRKQLWYRTSAEQNTSENRIGKTSIKKSNPNEIIVLTTMSMYKANHSFSKAWEKKYTGWNCTDNMISLLLNTNHDHFAETAAFNPWCHPILIQCYKHPFANEKVIIKPVGEDIPLTCSVLLKGRKKIFY